MGKEEREWFHFVVDLVRESGERGKGMVSFCVTSDHVTTGHSSGSRTLIAVVMCFHVSVFLKSNNIFLWFCENSSHHRLLPSLCVHKRSLTPRPDTEKKLRVTVAKSKQFEKNVGSAQRETSCMDCRPAIGKMYHLMRVVDGWTVSNSLTDTNEIALFTVDGFENARWCGG